MILVLDTYPKVQAGHAMLKCTDGILTTTLIKSYCAGMQHDKRKEETTPGQRKLTRKVEPGREQKNTGPTILLS